MSEKTLVAFHGDPKIKAKYVARVKAHARADAIVKGQYWENGKGCAVGCTVEKNGNELPHLAYEKELGLPEWLARLEDQLFESLPNEEAMKFPLKFLQAIPVGARVGEKEKRAFLHWLLVDKKDGVFQYAKGYPDCEKAIKKVAELLLRKNPSQEELAAAWAAADAAALAARAAAWAVAEAVAGAAAGAARAAARAAAWAVAWAAADAAWAVAEAVAGAAARAAATTRQAEALLKILKNARVQKT